MEPDDGPWKPFEDHLPLLVQWFSGSVWVSEPGRVGEVITLILLAEC